MSIKIAMKDDNSSPIKIWTNDIEESALNQLRNVAKLPFIHKHVAAMPDVHWGIGCTVGSVIATRGAVIPAAVGVDIGCGMIAAKLPLRADQLPDNLHELRSEIERRVPHGRTDNGGSNDRGAWGEAPKQVQQHMLELVNYPAYDEYIQHHIGFRGDPTRQLGTLGTGNHFIEVCLDKEDNVWVMLHSGSRGIGNKIGTYFIELAKKDMEKFFVNLPDKDLAYFPEGTEHFDDYMAAVGWAQDYASVNRNIMARAVLDAIEHVLGFNLGNPEFLVNCHHNYVARENHYGANVLVTRKGAVRAREGDFGIIPGSMGARSFIVRGKGNSESFNSCSHGAGRLLGRSEAKRRYTCEDLAIQTRGIECRKDADIIDEIPAAYKDIEKVMENQSDLVEIVAELHQVLCVKG